MKTRIAGWILGLLVLATPAFAVEAAQVTMSISGVRSDNGYIRVAVFNQDEAFPRGTPVAGHNVMAMAGTTVIEFGSLPPGRYAIAFYHDEDGDASFDRSFIGIPVEGFGFSNDAPVVLGPPSFEEAAIEVGDDVAAVARMRY